jgi:hypothetical protein
VSLRRPSLARIRSALHSAERPLISQPKEGSWNWVLQDFQGTIIHKIKEVTTDLDAQKNLYQSSYETSRDFYQGPSKSRKYICTLKLIFYQPN